MARVVIHPLWNGDSGDGHDLAVIELATPVPLPFRPIQVGATWDNGAYAPNLEATIMGRGRTDPDEPSDGEFRAADTPLRSDSDMDDVFNRWYTFDNWIEYLMIGAGSAGQTVCDGDSGGPLVVSRNGVPVQVGVASAAYYPLTSDGCATAGMFAELRGAQLAWLGHVVPEIVPAWGGCHVPRAVTATQVHFGENPVPYGATDGRFHWRISCITVVPPPPPPPTPPAPLPPDEGPGPVPEICKRKPWLCESAARALFAPAMKDSTAAGTVLRPNATARLFWNSSSFT